MSTVCLDAGHGQDSRTRGVFDPGAVSAGLRESDLTWALINAGAYVAKELFPGKIKVALTRDSIAESSPLRARTAEARAEGAEFLISCHLNSASASAGGIETFYRAGDAGDRWLASVVQKAGIEAFDLRDRGLKTEEDSQHPTLAILRGSTLSIPACLVEMGFITNQSDRLAIWDADDRDKRIAFWSDIFEAILDRRRS